MTIFYVLIGLGVFVALLTSIARQYLNQKAQGGAATRRRLRAFRRIDGPG